MGARHIGQIARDAAQDAQAQRCLQGRNSIDFTASEQITQSVSSSREARPCCSSLCLRCTLCNCFSRRCWRCVRTACNLDSSLASKETRSSLLWRERSPSRSPCVTDCPCSGDFPATAPSTVSHVECGCDACAPFVDP